MTTPAIHPATASAKVVLDACGVLNPQTRQPLSEALLLGIGGGLGAGYILWEFKARDSANIVMGVRNNWHKTPLYLAQLADNLGATYSIQEASKQKAARNLEAALASGAPCLVWVDKAHLPYQHLPEHLKGYISHVVAALALDDTSVTVHDLAAQPFRVPLADFAAARDRIVSDKNRLMTLLPPAEPDLPAAVQRGIAEQIAHLSSPSESFSLPVLDKWSKLVTHPKDKKSWRVVFSARSGLYTTLQSIYEHIVVDETEGSGLRQLYADFLREAAALTGNAALNDAASVYETAGAAWRALAAAALPDQVAEFRTTKTLLHQRYAAYRAQDMAALASAIEQLIALQGDLNGANFPLDAAGTEQLFAGLQTSLTALYQAEVKALDVLKQAAQGG